jgi:8-oxo-dGTP diphosphatase
VTPALEPVRRIAAYGVCRTAADEVLLVRHSPHSGTPGVWSLPGGAVDHGENPNDTVVRETAAETGLSVAVVRLRDVRADMRSLPHRAVTIHTDRLIYDVSVRGGTLISRIGHPTDVARFVAMSEAATLPLRAFTATVLGLPVPAVDPRPDEAPDFPSFYAYRGPDGLHRAHRRGRLLLTRVAPGYPGGGRWHLPGGGTDYGEQPGVALIRELAEETGQRGRLGALIGVASHRDAASLGPEGYPIDWHGVRAFYRVSVARPTRPTVHDQGGSTDAARWFSAAEVAALGADEMTEVTVEALGALSDG